MESDNTARPPVSGRALAGLALYPLSHLVLESYSSLFLIAWPLLSLKFGLAYGAVGVLTMLSRIVGTVPQLGLAPLADRYGSRLMAASGLLCMAAGVSAVGLVPNLIFLVVIVIISGLGSAAVHPAGTAYVSWAMPSRRGTGVAIFMIGGTIGTAVGPLLGAYLFEHWGLPATPWLMPVGLALAAAMMLILPVDPPPHPAHKRHDEGRSPIPFGIILLLIVASCQTWGEISLMTYVPLLFTERGQHLSAASQVLAIISLVSTLGVMVGGPVSDRAPRWAVIATALAVSLPFYAGILLLQGNLPLLAAAGFGFFSALAHPVLVAFGLEMMPERPGLASALMMGINWLIGAVGAALTGVLADFSGMQFALLLNTALPAIGLLTLALLMRWQRRAQTVQSQPLANA